MTSSRDDRSSERAAASGRPAGEADLGATERSSDRAPAGADAAGGGAGDRVRRILHCDMDCFYAAVHQRDDPSLAGRPLVIGGSPDRRGVVAAASYEVRRFGVRSAMPSSQARRLCPDAIFLRPDFPRYREESKTIFEIFRSFTETVQPVSIDEAYLDVTARLGEWGSATAIAEAIRRRVRDERRLTVSVGVGPNRLVAKIASDRDKPDGLTVVPPSRVLDFLAPLEVRVLQGVGPATASVLREELGVRTVRDLRAISEATLTRRFGRFGETLWRYARGIDERPVLTETERKSLSSECTYDQDLVGLAAMDEEIERQARGVAEALARRRLAGATIQLKVRYDDFTTVTRSTTLSAPTDDGDVISTLGRELLRRTDASERPVRLLGIGVAKLCEEGEPRQLVLPVGSDAARDLR